MFDVTTTEGETNVSLQLDEARVGRREGAREYVMCRPTHFAVHYAINPWMAPGPVDVELAMRQWEELRLAYEALGHTVTVIDGPPGLPDAVFAANGALVVDGTAYGASFVHPERQPEGPLYASFLRGLGLSVVEPLHGNEGEGDFLVLGDVILAGTGFRTSTDAHREVQALFGRQVVTLELVDPRFYHLDTAMSVLDERTIAYHPAAFSAASQRMLQAMFPDAVVVEGDAHVLGLNAVSDGEHVVLPAAARTFARDLRRRGYRPVPVDLSEFLKAGGSVKCCTLEIRR
jgi:N-dimethylarginine dimethylaminohydrolase